jgi:hypothetical protein
VSLVEGEAFSAAADVKNAVFTSDGAYQFSASKQQLYGVNDYVVSWTARVFAPNISELYAALKPDPNKGPESSIDPSFLAKNTEIRRFGD